MSILMEMPYIDWEVARQVAQLVAAMLTTLYYILRIIRENGEDL